MNEVAPEPEARGRPRWRKKRYAVPGLSTLSVLVLALAAWSDRETIADDLIREQLDAYGIEATYEIDRIGGQTQILSNLVIGDPARPDLTAERVVIRLRHRLGLPTIESVRLERPRLYASYTAGALSFGSLDPLIFAESDDAAGLPEFELAIDDGRGLLTTDYGRVGVKLEGEGRLDDGFSGYVAATAPSLSFAGCEAADTTLYGRISTSGGRPSFKGPLRQEALRCAGGDLQANGMVAELAARTSAALDDPEVEARIDTHALRTSSLAASSLAGTVRMQWRGAAANARYSLAARGVETPQALAAVITAEGALRSRENFARVEVESLVEGNGLRLGRQVIAAIEQTSSSAAGTLIEPIARRIGASLQAQARGSSLEARVRYSAGDDGYSLMVPQAELRGGGGSRIVSLSRFEMSTARDGVPRYSGNIATGGPGLPVLSGRMEGGGRAGSSFRIAMQPYEAGGSRLAVPQLTIAQGDGGVLGFAGTLEASGPVPGGAIEGLSLPLKGRYDPAGGLTLWRECTRVTFRRLAMAELRIAGPGLTLCPPSGGAILRSGSAGLRFAAGVPSLDLRGTMADTPIRIASGPVGFAWPGTLRARDLDVTLGPPGTASRFSIADLDAQIGDDLRGTFADAEVALASVPLDIGEASGRWEYSDSLLSIGGASFTLSDRAEPDRFEPLVARNARLTLRDNIVEANAQLRDPYVDRLVTIADIRHNLSTGAGHADLDVPGIVFDENFQPAPSSEVCSGAGRGKVPETSGLSCLALGLVANAKGTVTGRGRIDWSPAGEITSTGTFTTESLDFAAAFGPVRGASGTIEFTDLLGLTTAPGQTLRVASVNPGVEVLDGEVEFALRNGEVLAVEGGSWPFMGGRLILRSVDFTFGKSEERRYIFEIVGLQAAQFVDQMELKNISATGTFDGTVPIVFDANGNGRIDSGMLISRAPGGNLSYVGELTYEDLSPIANYAFGALRSMDFSQMRVVMEGPLAGEIVTRVRFDGVRQGEGADRNFVTRQLARLPIQFRINIRAQFYQLLTQMKALYDPAAVRDPRSLGLLSDDGTRLLRRSITGEEVQPDIDPEDVIPDEPTIQEQESE